MKKLLIAAVVLLCAACSKEKEDIRFDKARFDEQRAGWLAAGITDYSFEIDYFSDAGRQKAVVRVVGGEVVSAENTLDPGGEPFSRFGGITDIFDDIDSAYAEHTKKIGAKELRGVYIEIKYDSRYHFPEYVDYSVGYLEPMYGGYYYTMKITGFTPAQ